MWPTQPLLSICLVSRNEQYQGDHLYRMRTCLDFLGKGLTAIGRAGDTEIILTDWGSEVPFHKEMVLPDEIHRLIKFLVVPKNIADAKQGKSTFSFVHGCNAAIRRSHGEFILDLSPDVMMTESALRSLFTMLDGGYSELPLREAIFTVPRRHFFINQALRKPSFRELRDYLMRNGHTLPFDIYGRGYGGQCGMVAHRAVWEELRGYDEKLVQWGWADTDMVMRATQRRLNANLGSYGIYGIHLDHHTQQNHPRPPDQQNPHDNAPEYVANGDGWGLHNDDLMVVGCEAPVAMDGPDETDRVGTAERWDLTVDQMEDKLTAVWAPIQKWLSSLVVKDAMYALPKEEMDAYVAMAGYASYRPVRTYVETGATIPFGACVVTRMSPGVEIYGLVEWPHGAEWEMVSCAMLTELGNHNGYVRFVGGPPETAVTRLAGSTGGRFGVDLIYARGPAQQAVDLARYLRPGGAIITPHQKTLRALRSLPSLSCFRLGDGESPRFSGGIAIAATLRGRSCQSA